MMSNEINPEMMTEMPVVDPEETGISELSEGQLDEVSGGFGMNFGGFDSFFGSSGSGYSEENFFSGQSTFAGPDGAGTTSFAGYSSKESFAFQTIDFES
ncbi:MAG: hypothetical protein AAGD25_02555 [Cyanobacteria bacterium P01_F01_bin.150]